MDSNELRDQLVSLLNWDADVAAGVTAAITQASSLAEIDTILKDYIPASEKQARKSRWIFCCGQISIESKASGGGRAAGSGCCTYCGNRVRLIYTDGSTNEVEKLIDGAVDNNININHDDGSLDENEADISLERSREEAEALRDRLVEFDRQAAQRTTVIDDQSDYFAIDSNAWLSDEERAELKRRQAEAEAAAEAAKKRMTVTVDLLGRRVIMDGASQEDSLLIDDTSAAIEAAMAATAAEKPQGGGSAVCVFNSTNMNNARMMPSGGCNKYIFITGGKKGGKKSSQGARGVEKQQDRPVVERLQHDDPFELAAKELGEILAPWRSSDIPS
ncbi:hypothetical protein KSW81_008048 [Nannochloris sp. 'desiccata']|nr:hypothetical protein KSW81_008048 [Chlorella desiccata (nom. nud.)]